MLTGFKLQYYNQKFPWRFLELEMPVGSKTANIYIHM